MPRVAPVGDRGRYVLTVARPSAETTIGWNPEYAFTYGEELYAELRAAYDTGDTQRLAGLWSTARRVAYTVASRAEFLVYPSHAVEVTP